MENKTLASMEKEIEKELKELEGEYFVFPKGTKQLVENREIHNKVNIQKAKLQLIKEIREMIENFKKEFAFPVRFQTSEKIIEKINKELLGQEEGK